MLCANKRLGEYSTGANSLVREGHRLLLWYCLVAILAIGSALASQPKSPATTSPQQEEAKAETTIIGMPSVIDGDTIEIRSIRIRLHGIDAPESGQFCREGQNLVRCGQRAALTLDGFISGANLVCETLGHDRYRRVIGRCLKNDVDIGDWMVRSGWAIAYRRYSQDYVNSEKVAKSQKLGLWNMQFDVPEDHRKGKRTIN